MTKEIYYEIPIGCEYEQGSVIDGDILAFPELKTAVDFGSLDYCGNVPLTGSIAVGEVLGEYRVEPLSAEIADLCVRARGMRITGIRRFINGVEVE